MSLPFRKFRAQLAASWEFHRLRRASEHGRKRFTRASAEEYRREACGRPLPGVGLVSLCGLGQLALQSLSMLSFLRHVGLPETWTVVSDGTLDEASRQHLREVFPAVRFREWTEFITPENRACVERYAVYPMGKKLAVVTAMKTDGTVIYSDSDVLFFAGGKQLAALLGHVDRNYFLADNEGGTYLPLLHPEERLWAPLNAGFLIQASPISWQEPLARLDGFFREHPDFGRDDKAVQLLEQTVCFLGYNQNGGEALPSEYVLQLDDAYSWQDRHINERTVLRHYVVHTRMKLWLHAREYLPVH